MTRPMFPPEAIVRPGTRPAPQHASLDRSITRNAGLDVARAIAIVLVFASHTVVEMVSPVFVTLFSWGGRAGVELFFSLSGFLIGGILIRTAEQADFGPRAVAAFLFRRWMRTLPLYFVALWFASWFFDKYNLHAFLLLQNFYPAEPRMLPVSWSLVMEEYFYFFFPLTMLLLAAALGRGMRLVAVTAIILIVVCNIGRLVYALGGIDMGVNDMTEHPFIRMDCAAYGVIAACLLRPGSVLQSWLTDRRARRLLVAVTLVSMGWCAIFIAIVHLPQEWLLTIGYGAWGRFYLSIQWPTLGPIFAVAVVALYRMRIPSPRWLAWLIRQISLTSYSIYLVHGIAMVLVSYYAFGGTGLLRFATLIAVTAGLSAFTYHTIERPMLRLRDWAVPGQ